MHEVGGPISCISAELNYSLFPDVVTCGKSCEVEGVDYSSHGIKAEGSLTLHLFSEKENVNIEASPRVYLLTDVTTYEILTLLNL
jgi:cellulose 1,4-beta-cellobiosidase